MMMIRYPFKSLEQAKDDAAKKVDKEMADYWEDALWECLAPSPYGED